jgi:GTP-binding protein
VEGGTEGSLYRIVGEKPERWVEQTDFTNDEAVGFLADRLMKIGIDEALFEAGATPGAAVIIGAGKGQVFDWEPTLSSAAELMAAPRGTDPRLEENQRATRAQRKQSYHERMDAKARARAELGEEKEAGLWADDD